MAKVWYNLIRKKLKTIEDVPVTWKKAVQALLDADKAKELQEPVVTL